MYFNWILLGTLFQSITYMRRFKSMFSTLRRKMLLWHLLGVDGINMTLGAQNHPSLMLLHLKCKATLNQTDRPEQKGWESCVFSTERRFNLDGRNDHILRNRAIIVLVPRTRAEVRSVVCQFTGTHPMSAKYQISYLFFYFYLIKNRYIFFKRRRSTP